MNSFVHADLLADRVPMFLHAACRFHLNLCCFIRLALCTFVVLFPIMTSLTDALNTKRDASDSGIDAAIERTLWNALQAFVDKRVADVLNERASESDYQDQVTYYSSETESDCQHLLTDPSGEVIYSPHGKYPNVVNCLWTISAPLRHIVEINVTSLDIEGPDATDDAQPPDKSLSRGSSYDNDEATDASDIGRCRFGYLAFYDGPTADGTKVLDRLCGTVPPKNSVMSTSSTVHFIFWSDQFLDGNGFQLTYRAVATESSGNGDDASIPADLQRHGKVQLEDGCSVGVFNVIGSSGIIRSPGFEIGQYPNNAQCQWLVSVKPGQIVRLKFLKLILEREEDCLYDYVSLYDGRSVDSQRLGRYCDPVRQRKLTVNLTSTGPSLLVLMVTDDSVNDGGFAIGYTAQNDPYFNSRNVRVVKRPPGCNGQLAELDQPSGRISSPGFSKETNGTYESNIRCEWRITIEPGMRVYLHFEVFRLEPGRGVECFDAVRIYDAPDTTGPGLISTNCGRDIPGDFLSSKNVVCISFETDSGVGDIGFSVAYMSKEQTNSITAAGSNNTTNQAGVACVEPIRNRIVGGEESAPHSWPWICSVRYGGKQWKHWCGCTVISAEWILTAAHCVDGYGPASSFVVVVGEHSQTSSEGSRFNATVLQVKVHENYAPDTSNFDIALLKVLPLQLNCQVRPVCLPSRDPPADTLCVTTGWGRTNTNAEIVSVLHQVYVPVISITQCNEESWYNGLVTEYMMCAGFADGGRDACQGDSGGPLLTLEPSNRYCIVGIVSWGFGCGQAKHPGVYTRVSRFLRWITAISGGMLY